MTGHNINWWLHFCTQCLNITNCTFCSISALPVMIFDNFGHFITQKLFYAYVQFYHFVIYFLVKTEFLNVYNVAILKNLWFYMTAFFNTHSAPYKNNNISQYFQIIVLETTIIFTLLPPQINRAVCIMQQWH